MTDPCDCAELVAGKVRPGASCGPAGAEGAETRAGDAEVAECAVEFSDVKLGVVNPGAG